ncbi:hypothetical protein [Patiriisocius marinus]|uniref:hypothetical protein n=1 Tax=Patiriisocius marinus TaxID=1397112 RepID=UPI002330B515|nr:hypothetical protein [Patiriisocius marinus]
MKKLAFIMVTVFLNTALFSCTPNSIVENSIEQACCDGEDNKPPPPPPPPSDD